MFFPKGDRPAVTKGSEPDDDDVRIFATGQAPSGAANLAGSRAATTCRPESDPPPSRGSVLTDLSEGLAATRVSKSTDFRQGSVFTRTEAGDRRDVEAKKAASSVASSRATATQGARTADSGGSRMSTSKARGPSSGGSRVPPGSSARTGSVHRPQRMFIVVDGPMPGLIFPPSGPERPPAAAEDAGSGARPSPSARMQAGASAGRGSPPLHPTVQKKVEKAMSKHGLTREQARLRVELKSECRGGHDGLSPWELPKLPPRPRPARTASRPADGFLSRMAKRLSGRPDDPHPPRA